MKYYPVYLNIQERRVLVVGAGEIAWQKIPALLESQAQVRVVAPEALSEIEELARAAKLEWIRRPYQSADLDQVSLVIAATDDSALQKQIAAEARARGIWINVVDVTPLCDFIAPAVLSRGDVQIAVSTGGASPALAQFIRQKLEPLLGPEYAIVAAALQRHRPDILKLPKVRRQAIWEAIINEDFLNRLRREGDAAVETKIQELLYAEPAI